MEIRRFSHIMVLGLPSAEDLRIQVLLIRVRDGQVALDKAYDAADHGGSCEEAINAAETDLSAIVADPLERDALWQVARQLWQEGHDWRETTVTANIGRISWTDQVV
ncbi:MAG: hypothetical protein HYY51_03150 [Candidatus Magasanikbacteria bacterium]|nr:hypothetical protein [Candidatus Magasanikbacteria bacterium]